MPGSVTVGDAWVDIESGVSQDAGTTWSFFGVWRRPATDSIFDDTNVLLAVIPIVGTSGFQPMSFRDLTPASGVEYTWRVTVHFDDEDPAPGEMYVFQETATMYLDAVWLSCLNRGDNDIHRFFYARERGESVDKGLEPFHPVDQRFMSSQFSHLDREEHRVVLQLPDFPEDEDFLEHLMYCSALTVMRDYRGRKIIGMVDGLDIQETRWGSEVSLNIIKTRSNERVRW